MPLPSSKRRAHTEPSFAAPQIARLCGFDRHGQVLVQLEPGGVPLPARLALSAPVLLDTAVAAHAQALVLFEDGDRGLPIVVACIPDQSFGPPAPVPAPSAATERAPESAGTTGSEAPRASEERISLDALVAGKRVHIEAEDELVLSAGKATITLRRNGKVVVRGTYIETYASGTNRIKGAQVRVN